MRVVRVEVGGVAHPEHDLIFPDLQAEPAGEDVQPLFTLVLVERIPRPLGRNHDPQRPQVEGHVGEVPDLNPAPPLFAPGVNAEDITEIG